MVRPRVDFGKPREVPCVSYVGILGDPGIIKGFSVCELHNSGGRWLAVDKSHFQTTQREQPRLINFFTDLGLSVLRVESSSPTISPLNIVGDHPETQYEFGFVRLPRAIRLQIPEVAGVDLGT